MIYLQEGWYLLQKQTYCYRLLQNEFPSLPLKLGKGQGHNHFGRFLFEDTELIIHLLRRTELNVAKNSLQLDAQPVLVIVVGFSKIDRSLEETALVTSEFYYS